MREKMTPQGRKKLLDELHELLTVVLPDVRQRMALANEDGDLPENNPWLTAKEEFETAKIRIDEIRKILFDIPVAIKRKSNIIQIGDTVTIELRKKRMTFVIGSTYEADPDQQIISTDSPLGKALLYKKVGQTVQSLTPVGTISIKIISKK